MSPIDAGLPERIVGDQERPGVAGLSVHGGRAQPAGYEPRRHQLSVAQDAVHRAIRAFPDEEDALQQISQVLRPALHRRLDILSILRADQARDALLLSPYGVMHERCIALVSARSHLGRPGEARGHPAHGRRDDDAAALARRGSDDVHDPPNPVDIGKGSTAELEYSQQEIGRRHEWLWGSERDRRRNLATPPALSGLTSLPELFLGNNPDLTYIQPLLDNTGLGAGDFVDLTYTNVSCADVNVLRSLSTVVRHSGESIGEQCPCVVRVGVGGLIQTASGRGLGFGLTGDEAVGVSCPGRA